MWNCIDLRVECMDVYPKFALEPASLLLKLTMFDLVFNGNQRVAPQMLRLIIPEFLQSHPGIRVIIVESQIQ